MNAQDEIAPDLLHVFHEEGTESFPITYAAFNICEEGDRTLLVVHVRCGRAKVAIQEFDRLFAAEPWFELVLHLAGGAADIHDGSVFFPSCAFDEVRVEHISNFYYVRHSDIEELRVEVLRSGKSAVKFRIGGLTGAAHGDADTRFAIDAEIPRVADLVRSLN